MDCASETWQPMQLQINVPLKIPNQIFHDVITHNVTHVDIQNALVEQKKFEKEGDGKLTDGNFKAVAREGDLSPGATIKNSKKGKKQTQDKEVSQPI